MKNCAVNKVFFLSNIKCTTIQNQEPLKVILYNKAMTSHCLWCEATPYNNKGEAVDHEKSNGTMNQLLVIHKELYAQMSYSTVKRS
jgi:hypothetical protein